MHSNYSKKKLFIFHNEETIQHLERQSNQSLYVENLILKNIYPDQNTNTDIQHLLKEIKQQLLQSQQLLIKKEEIEIYQQDNSISSSITNILNFK